MSSESYESVYILALAWFRVVLTNLEGPRSLRSVPYDPETFPRPPQCHVQSGIGNGPFECLGTEISDPSLPKIEREISPKPKIEPENSENH